MKSKKDININPRQGEMKILSMSVLPLIRSIIGNKGLVVADMISLWKKIVGEEMAAYTLPEKMEFAGKNRDNGVLRLRVPNGAFALEVQHRKNFLMQRINAYFGYNAVADIRIVQDGNRNWDADLKNNQLDEEKILVSEDEQIYIEQLSDGIKNEKLKEKLVSLGKKVFNSNHK